MMHAFKTIKINMRNCVNIEDNKNIASYSRKLSVLERFSQGSTAPSL